MYFNIMSITVTVEQYNGYMSRILKNKSNTTWIMIDSCGDEWNQGPIYKKKLYMDEDRKLYVVYGPNNGFAEWEYLLIEDE